MLKHKKKNTVFPRFWVLISFFLAICYVDIKITQILGNDMQDFDTLLKNSAAAHGHLYPGQVVGV
jgi:hypothetical protein